MIRLHVTAEGQTEQRFVQTVLAPHLASFNVFTDARCVLTSRDKKACREYRGGLDNYMRAKRDIQAWLEQDADDSCRFTTMFDLYALPEDFPGFAAARVNQSPYSQVAMLEAAFLADIGGTRFVPYIQLHEFESLILAEPNSLDWEYLEHDRAIAGLVAEIGEQNPELVNDGPTTAPSKRILAKIPEYDKATAGVAVTSHIGLATLRRKCTHFGEWLTRLEGLAGA